MEKIKNLVAAAKANKKELGIKALTLGGTAIGAFALGAVLSKSDDDVEIASLEITETDTDGSTTTTTIVTNADDS